jgi:hypothetical protein
VQVLQHQAVPQIVSVVQATVINLLRIVGIL